MLNPQARQDDIVVQELFDEVVIYDLKRDKVHALNPTAALVWRHCDGQHTSAELTNLLQAEFHTPQADVLLELTLDRLHKAHLLAGKVSPVHNQRIITRREALKLAGLTVALLPVVKSIIAPTMAQASSPNKSSMGCLSGDDCASGICVGGVCQ